MTKLYDFCVIHKITKVIDHESLELYRDKKTHKNL